MGTPSKEAKVINIQWSSGELRERFAKSQGRGPKSRRESASQWSDGWERAWCPRTAAGGLCSLCTSSCERKRKRRQTLDFIMKISNMICSSKR